jgi:hypothetical protein
MAGSLQMAEAGGAETARGLEYKKTGTQLGMAQQRLGAAKQARAAATQSIMGGVGGLLGAGVEAGAAPGGFLEKIVG